MITKEKLIYEKLIDINVDANNNHIYFILLPNRNAIQNVRSNSWYKTRLFHGFRQFILTHADYFCADQIMNQVEIEQKKYIIYKSTFTRFIE